MARRPSRAGFMNGMAAGRRRGWRAAAVLALLPLASAGAPQAAEPPAPEMGRDVIEQWVQTRSLIGKERQEWRVGRVVLTDRIDLLRREIDGLREKTGQATNELTDVDAKLAELRAEKGRLREATAGLQGDVAGLEAKLRELVAKVPDPVKERIKPLMVRMPTDSGNTKIPLPERLQVVVGILNELTKANGEILQAVEIRTMPDGKSAEVRSVYVGLAEGYYVSARGDAGTGKVHTNGWQWTAANELAEPVRAVLDILQNKGSPRFIPLPGEVK